MIASLGACGTLGFGRGPDAGKPWVVVGLAHGVDRKAPAVGELIKELSARARVEVVKATPRAEIKSAEGAVKRALKNGKQLYLRMQMDEAAEKLEGALERVRATFAKELDNKDLAQLHLHLAAVRYASQKMERFRRHCRAAVAYDPDLSPNADLFSPPVRQCIERARANRVEHEITLVVLPADATVVFDGVAKKAGEALGPQVAGEHFLRVEHPLYQTWGRVLLLSAKAHVEVKLRPASPAVIVSTALKRPDLARQALPLLGAHALALLHKEGATVALRALGPKEELTRELAELTPSAVLAENAAGVVRIAGRSGLGVAAATSRSSSQPTSQAAGGSPLWKSPWLWGAVAAGALVAILVPIAASSGAETTIDPGSGRPVRLEVPWP